MKTAGDLLKAKRLALELSLADVAKKTKVKEEYLLALETSDFSALPSATFAKGFLKNYARVLHIDPEVVIAMFRRDFAENAEGEIIPRGLVEPVVKKTSFIPVNLILSGIAVFAFLSFLAFQLVSWWSLPDLTLLQPEDGETYGEKVTVKGTTESDATILINNQQVIVDGSGQFSLDLIFPAGTHSVLVQATNRQNKTRLLERSFTVSK
jgi:cytoskeletal protein RodZ